MTVDGGRTISALILTLPESAGSAVYGLVDVFASTGTLWRELIGDQPGTTLIDARIVSTTTEPFLCGNRVPVRPDLTISDDAPADIIVIPELWLSSNDDLVGRYDDVKEWVRRRHRAGAVVYSACSGSVLLASAGLLNGRPATSHWGYTDLFRRSFPDVRYLAEPNIVFADPAGSIVTAGGATSWHDLAIHIISRHCSPGDAVQVAKVFLLQPHGEGQLPYTGLVRKQAHADAVVRQAENWLTAHFSEPHAVAGVVSACKIPERSLKRRFKAATGSAIIDYVQNLRVEAAKRLLEATDVSSDGIASRVGYENPAFFRRLFKRLTGLTAGEYRRMFRPIAKAADPGLAFRGRPSASMPAPDQEPGGT